MKLLLVTLLAALALAGGAYAGGDVGPTPPSDGGGGSGMCQTPNDIGQWKNIGGGLFYCTWSQPINVFGFYINWTYQGPA